MEYFPKLLESPTVPPEDKSKIKELLKKSWNHYIRQALNTKNIRHDYRFFESEISITLKRVIDKHLILKIHRVHNFVLTYFILCSNKVA